MNLKAKAVKEIIDAKRTCASLMHSYGVREFKFVDSDGFRQKARLRRPTVDRVSVHKLYVLVREQEISLDDFFECVTANEEAVKDLLGEQRMASVSEQVTKGLDLVITRA